MLPSLHSMQASIRLSTFARTLGLFALLAGCGADGPSGTDDGGGTGPASSAATVTVTPSSSLLDVGKTVALSAQVFDSAGAALSRTVTWASSDSAVATVSGGVVTARQGGTAVITARSGTVSALAFLAIVDPAVGSVAVTPANDTIAPGATAQLAAQVRDTAGNALAGRRITWQVSDPRVATVSSSGVVSAKVAGTVVVRALAQNVVGAAILTIRPAAALTVADAAGRLALSQDHACGLALDGITYCWGAWYGKAQGSPQPTLFHARPDTIHGGHRFTQIVGTGNVTAGLKADGTVWVWGLDEGSSLVGGGVAYTPVQALTSARFVKLIPGNYNLFALTADGQLYAWGYNDFGELGIGNSGPQQYPMPAGGNLRFRSVSNEDDHGSLLLTTDGAVYAAGLHGNATLRRLPSPHAFASLGGYTAYGDTVIGITAEGIAYAVDWSGVARRTGGDYTYRKIMRSGSTTTFGLTTDGRIINWDFDPFTLTATPPAERVAAGRRFLDMDVQAAGLLALADDGDLVVFGSNEGSRLMEYWETATIDKGTGPYGAVYWLSQQPEALSIEPGGTGSFRIRLEEIFGGFTLFGPRRFTRPIALALSQPIDGVEVAILPDVLHGDNAEAVVTARVSANKLPGAYNIKLSAKDPGSTEPPPAPNVPLTVPQPPPPSGDGTTLNLVCTSRSTPLPAGFHCLENSAGNLVPGKFAGDSKFNALMHGTYVDEGAGVCFTWNADGTATARYSGAGLGGGGPRQTGTGQWGVIVRKSGVPEGTTTKWYVFTSILDAQTQLLGFDSAAPDGARIMGWQFSKRSCPW